jgi:hypothetical protein
MSDQLPEILQTAESCGFVVFKNGDYNLNIIGVRSVNPMPNLFIDKIYLVYKSDGNWVEEIYPITTDAGTYWLENPSRVLGTAVLVHDKQYRGVYKLGLHRGNYEALVQTGGEVLVWRDNNKDDVVDFGGPEYSGYFGINIHRANSSRQSTQVDRWSAGCQVFANPSHFSRLIQLAKLQIRHGHGDSFSYTLLSEKTIDQILIDKQESECQAEESKSQSKLPKKSSLTSSKSSKKSMKPKGRKAKAGQKSPKPSDKK